MKNLIKTCLLVMVVFGLIAGFNPPQVAAAVQDFAISGKVTNYNGEPAVDALVECNVHAWGKWEEGIEYTDPSGNLTFTLPGACWPDKSFTSSVYTDSSGSYSCNITVDYTPDSECAGLGHDLTYRRFAWAEFESKGIKVSSEPNSDVIDIINCPNFVSPSRQIYARRVTQKMTPYPIVHFEGFDPPDAIKSGPDIEDAIPGLNYMDMMEATELPGGLNVLSHMMINGYTFWIVMNGTSSGDSYRGTSGNHYTDGQIYQGMTVVKQIADLHRVQYGNQFRGLIIGGFSGGGLLSRTGLLYWCNGYWWNASNYGLPGVDNIDLPEGCYDVLGWYAGDSPLEGCMMPSSLQKFAYSDEFGSSDPGLSRMRKVMFENQYSAEILKFVVPWYDNPNLKCYLGCNLDDGENSCSSTSWGDDGCPFDTSRFDTFIHWAYGGYDYPNQYKPLRNGETGTPVPGVAWSHGTYVEGHSKGGYKFTTNGHWLDIHIDLSDFKDKHVYLHSNIAGASDENVNGSYFSQFVQLRDLEGKSTTDDFDIPTQWGIWGTALSIGFFGLEIGMSNGIIAALFNLFGVKITYKLKRLINQTYLPTYMPTTSTLGANTIGLSFWNDYHWQDQNCAHIPSPPALPDLNEQMVPIPVVDPDENGGFGQTEIQMMLGFAHEQMKGQGSASPICDEGYPNNGVRYHGKKASCRTGSTEVCNCEDDDGDECVDGTMTANGCQPLANCSPDKACEDTNCAPACYNRECGTDGCGGYCGNERGTCGKGQECIQGQCQDKTFSCAADPSMVDACVGICDINPIIYTWRWDWPNACMQNCIFDKCPGGGDDDGDTIWGAGIWDFDARVPEDDNYYSHIDRYTYIDESGNDPCEAFPPVCMKDFGTGGRDVAFLWRPSELRYREVKMAIWPANNDYLFVIRKGDCSGQDLICADCGPFNGITPKLNDFYAAEEQYCIIVDTWSSDADPGNGGDIGQLRIWDAATDEDCDNGQDDDGNGVADCEDWKCFGDSACQLSPCVSDCVPHLWVNAQETEGNIWYYDGDNWRDENSYDPSCGAVGGKEGVLIWYADRTGYWDIDTFGSNYDTVLWVKRGTYGADTEFACNNDANGTQQSEVRIYAQKGETFMIAVDTNGTFDPTGTNVEVNANYVGLDGGGCYGGLDGDWEFCQVVCPCNEGQGDCDSDEECAPGLICDYGYIKDICVDDPASSYSGGSLASQKLYRPQSRADIYQMNEFDSSRLVPYQPYSNLQAPKRDIDGSIILAEEICQASQCEGDFCNVECPCAEGGGDCDSDAECASGLECFEDVGPEWGCGQYIDICVDPANPDGPIQTPGGGCTGDSICGWDFCTPDCPCLEGQGDCDDSNNDCLGELVCTQDVGDSYGCASDVDVCTVDPATSGGGCVNAARCETDFCDPSCPCNEGYGDCTDDIDCAAGLVCAQNVGESYGCPAATNICVTPGFGGGCQGGSQCDAGFCRPECPCLEGQGDCLNDRQCAEGLKCEPFVGLSYGCDAWDSICVFGLKNCDPDYCSTSNRCHIGRGDCDSNAECHDGLICRQDVGAEYGCDDPSIDICDLDPNLDNGGCQGGSQCDLGFCDSNCPCYEGQGQCDTDADCSYLLVCRVDENNIDGCGSTADMCMLPEGGTCTPDCGTRQCGPVPNGCGTTCGSGCSTGETCSDGTCVPQGSGGDIGYTTVFSDTSTATDRRAQPVTATEGGYLQK
jgi:hypothetical protein